MNYRNLTLSAAALLIVMTGCKNTDGKTEEPTSLVNTYIGTGGHGHVFMGANVPFGFVQLGPTSIPEEWDWTSGYHISDTTVIGFSHTHLSGTGIGDLSDITFMPVVGEVKYARGEASDPKSGLWSYYSRANEETKPGFYATHLDRYGIDVKLTATKRVGFHRYTFPENSQGAVVIDLENGSCWDESTEVFIQRESDTKVSGYRYSKGWANNQKVFFAAEFSEPIISLSLFDGEKTVEGTTLTAQKLYARLGFDTKKTPALDIKVALSPVSIDNAWTNMEAELPHWDFEKCTADANTAWNEELSKIEVKGATPADREVFYTALYHTMIAPATFCDVNGDYRGSDDQIHTGNKGVNYTTFSLWDTYRAAHPLMTIIHPEKMPDMVNTMLNIFDQQGKLPVWHLMGCETDCMVGNPGISVVADAILKGVGGFDVEHAYEAMKKSAMLDERGMDLRKEYGYIPFDKHNESVAICMEYAIADWTVAQVAAKLGKTEDFEYFNERSHSYRKYFDPSIGFIRGLDSKGKFREDFNPFESKHRENDYTEGNAWQYTWLAPHDVDGLINLFGSREKFIAKLDSLFVATGDLGENASPDISGLIGQYAHGNEPSHHVAYLYTMVGEPWKTAEKVRYILTNLYTNKPDGLSGNEDVGQMSAWYILSSMGFYQVEPAGGHYYFGSPLFDEVKINVGNNKKFTVTAHNNSPENVYIQSIKLNGQPYDKNYIAFEDITAGGTLEFAMGNKPTTTNE